MGHRRSARLRKVIYDDLNVTMIERLNAEAGAAEPPTKKRKRPVKNGSRGIKKPKRVKAKSPKSTHKKPQKKAPGNSPGKTTASPIPAPYYKPPVFIYEGPLAEDLLPSPERMDMKTFIRKKIELEERLYGGRAEKFVGDVITKKTTEIAHESSEDESHTETPAPKSKKKARSTPKSITNKTKTGRLAKSADVIDPKPIAKTKTSTTERRQSLEGSNDDASTSSEHEPGIDQDNATAAAEPSPDTNEDTEKIWVHYAENARVTQSPESSEEE